MCYIQFAGYTDIVCSYVESNSERLVADDDTTSAVSPTRRGAHGKHMECGTAGETSMPPLKCGYFSSAA